MRIKGLQRAALATLGLAGILTFGFAKPVMAEPAAPTNITQTASTETGFKVTWTKGATATNYQVTVLSADGKTKILEATTNGAAEYTINDTEKKYLKAGTLYTVNVRAVDSTGTGEAGVARVGTAPTIPTIFEQTGATSTTIKLAWDKVPGATGYLIKMGASAASAKDLQIIATTAVELKSLNPDTAYYVAVYPVLKVNDKFNATEKFAYLNKVVTTAGPVSNVKLAEWDVRTNYIRFSWKNNIKYEGGYQIEICNANGKVFKTYNVMGRRTNGVGYYLKKLKNKGFSFRVRSYTTFNGEKSYGEWSEVVYCVPQANVTAKKASANSVTLSWDKITGAKNYTIYAAKDDDDDDSYTKIGTSKTTTFTAANLTEGADYYFLVKANKVKVGGKKKASTALDRNNDVYVTLYATKREAENK